MPLGLAGPNAYISVPVSPRILFVAAHKGAAYRWVSEHWRWDF